MSGNVNEIIQIKNILHAHK